MGLQQSGSEVLVSSKAAADMCTAATVPHCAAYLRLKGFTAAGFVLHDFVINQGLRLRQVKLHVVVSDICLVLVSCVVLLANNRLQHRNTVLQMTLFNGGDRGHRQ